MKMDVIANTDTVLDAYHKVRNDDNDDSWLLLKYDGNKIALTSTGVIYDEFLIKIGDDDRAYGYIRIETGDEMSKRAKFVFITWIGQNVSPLKKARVSTDKGMVKSLLSDFAVEKLVDDKDELKMDLIREEVIKAGGANYGTGQRE